MRRLVFLGLVLSMGLAGGASADQWDTADDDPSTTVNELSHGAVQAHDCAGGTATLEEDWYVVNSKVGHSYEFRTEGQNTFAYFEAGRYAADGTTSLSLLTTVGSGSNYGAKSFTWEQASANAGLQFIQVTGYNSGGVTSADDYTARFYETTIFIPRYNNTSGQLTVLMMQNTTGRTVNGSYNTFNISGGQVFGATFSIVPNGAFNVNLAGTPANNTSGTITISHNGGYGGINGKSVALEPATGFSFDSLGVPLPN
jgi:hypothetical protein